MAAFMTFPMSFGDAAAVSSTAFSTAAAISSSEISTGRYAFKTPISARSLLASSGLFAFSYCSAESSRCFTRVGCPRWPD